MGILCCLGSHCNRVNLVFCLQAPVVLRCNCVDVCGKFVKIAGVTNALLIDANLKSISNALQEAHVPRLMSESEREGG